MNPLRHFFQRLCWLTLGVFATVGVHASTIDFTAKLATPLIKAGKPQTVFLKVGLTGFSLPEQGFRPSVNVAIVIDKSGSMSGERIDRAKEAAIMAVNGLGGNDIVSIIAFDNTVEVVTPATKVTDKAPIFQAIRNIRAVGGTGLFAGVSKGAAEVRKFFDKNRVNRVILLSDGKANIGPSSPSELGQLGSLLARDGISVTTIGLGTDYNEDLMTQLAAYSDGNHAFVENARDLARVFQHEFRDVGAVVAQEVALTIRLKRGVRALRILGREGEIRDGVVRLGMNQLYSQQEKYVVLEVEVPAGKVGENFNLAAVDVSYLNMQSKSNDKLTRSVTVSYTESEDSVAKATDKKAMVSAVQQVSNLMSKEALDLRDKGQYEDAKKKMDANIDYLSNKAMALPGDNGKPSELKALEDSAKNQAATIGEKDSSLWNVQRKRMKEEQFKVQNQQR